VRAPTAKAQRRARARKRKATALRREQRLNKLVADIKSGRTTEGPRLLARMFPIRGRT